MPTDDLVAAQRLWTTVAEGIPLGAVELVNDSPATTGSTTTAPVPHLLNPGQSQEAQTGEFEPA